MTGFEGAIFGQQALAEQLSRLYSSQRTPSSLMVAGPEQSGKSLVVERLVDSLFSASHSIDLAPIEQPSEAWRLISQRAHPDLTWVGLEPNDKGVMRTQITVAQVQGLLSALEQTPVLSSLKIAVIDDADRMNATAANALLKRLEEPSVRSRIILITGAPGRLLPTIRSRCQVVTSASLSEDDFHDWAAQSGSTVAEDLYQLSGGAPGRALALMADGTANALRQLSQVRRAPIDISSVQRLARTVASLDPVDRVLVKQSYLSQLHNEAVESAGNVNQARILSERHSNASALISKADSLNLDEQSLWIRLLCQ